MFGGFSVDPIDKRQKDKLSIKGKLSNFFSIPSSFPIGLVVRITAFHAVGLGSIPRWEGFFFVFFFF